ncbi:MAG: ABC transporter substrate-binding protein [Fusobacteriaceae bacterium]|jgi:putative ABC transport system substrate-binding protein|nr:ABC transporter substrate-binding protein [Fusobacteriaceae bacterium]
MKKIQNLLLISILLSIGLFGKVPKDIKIGITQIVEHPSLDLSRKGFENALKNNGYGDTNIEFQNAQGDFNTAQLIAKGFVDSKKDLIFTISTPSSQAAYNATKDIPIVLTAVTDPKAAGLIGKNITGTSDPLPIKEQLELVKAVFPELKTIGLIYNTSEQNSIISIGEIKDECKKIGLLYEEVGVTSINDISPALDALLPKVDIIFMTTDNLVVSAISLVIEKSNKANKPVFASTEDQVPKGALMTKTIDFEKIGYRAGEMAIEILKGKAPSEIPIEPPKENLTIINKKVAEKYGINLGIDALKSAQVHE